jgi:hypothetical protein
MYWLCLVCDELNDKYLHIKSETSLSPGPRCQKYCKVCSTMNPVHNLQTREQMESTFDAYCTLNSIIDTFPSHTDGEEYYYITPTRMTLLRNSINFNISAPMVYNHLKSRMYYNSRHSWKKWRDKQRLKRRNSCNVRYTKMLDSKLNVIFRPRPMATILAYL